MKILKNISLIFLILFIASAVSNWGGEISKNPLVVTIGVYVSAFSYSLGDWFDD